jgi:hypothetical protein
LIGDNQNIFSRDDGQDSVNRFLEQGSITQKLDQLLGGRFPADRPETFPTTPSHDDRKLLLEWLFH